MVKRKKSKNKNLFVSFWNGELSLPLSYWGVGIGIGFLFGFIILAFVIAVDLSEDALWGFIIPFQIYTVVGIWRSANKYRGPKYWSILAKLAIIVGVISNLFSLLTGN